MNHLVCGISSSGRIVPDIDGRRFLAERAEGSYVWDDRGRRYVDTALGFGAAFLGHSDPEVTVAVRHALERGSMPAYAHALEEEAAASLTDHTGDLTRLIFLNSGSEAVHLACRTARAVTGRRRIVKMAAGYDGWFDEVAFGNAGSLEAAMETNVRPARDDVLLLRLNDRADADLLFAECDDIAAIVLEPMMANAGCIVAEDGYLEYVAALARRHGTLVIMDEVLMGSRLHAGLASHRFGVKPDLATVGKAIGNGFAVAALIGRPEIMAAFENHRVNHAGTYNGNPIACAAVKASMAVLDRVDYPRIHEAGDALRSMIVSRFAAERLEACTSGYGPVFAVWQGRRPPTTYEEARRRANPEFAMRLHLALRRAGIMSMAGAYGRYYLSGQYDKDVPQLLTDGFSEAARDLGG